MTVRENLLLMSRRRCEEQRRHLGELELLAERLRVEALRLSQRIGQAQHSPAAVSADALLERHARVERSIAEIEAQIGPARAAVAAAEQEVQRRERDWLGRGDRLPSPRPRRGLRRTRTVRLPPSPSSG